MLWIKPCCELLQFVAKKLDKRLMDLGGTAIVERGLGDDQHPSGYGYKLYCNWIILLSIVQTYTSMLVKYETLMLLDY